MTLIENALKKLRGAGAGGPEAQLPDAGRSSAARSGAGGAMHLGTTPRPGRKVTVEGPKHHVSAESLAANGLVFPAEIAGRLADEFRRIKRPIVANALSAGSNAEHGANVVMITSALPNAGKTFCSINLAASLSVERDLNVLLVDADVAKPRTSREFGLAETPGLIDLLVDEKALLSDLLVRTDFHGIQVLPAGRFHSQSTELLASARMSAVVRELATRYSDRLIILDGPPLLATSEAEALASQVGQIVLVVEAGRTSHEELRQTLEMLSPNKAVNVVLNKVQHWGQFGDFSGEYGYHSYRDS